ncbi:MAG: hypothetical protein ACJ74Q_15785 [Pyrinomonadaceae bacterium]
MSGGQSDDELRDELARAVVVAEQVIRGTTMPLPFAVSAEADGEGIDDEGWDGVSQLVN